MPANTYGDFVYFNIRIYAPREHQNQFILNQEPYFYITSLSNFMDETLPLLPNLFVNKMIKKDKLPYQSCVSVIKSCKTEQRK